MTFKLEIYDLCFMTKVNPNNGNETKSDVFAWDKSFFIKNYQSISMTFKIKISQFYD